MRATLPIRGWWARVSPSAGLQCRAFQAEALDTGGDRRGSPSPQPSPRCGGAREIRGHRARESRGGKVREQPGRRGDPPSALTDAGDPVTTADTARDRVGRADLGSQPGPRCRYPTDGQQWGPDGRLGLSARPSVPGDRGRRAPGWWRVDAPTDSNRLGRVVTGPAAPGFSGGRPPDPGGADGSGAAESVPRRRGSPRAATRRSRART